MNEQNVKTAAQGCATSKPVLKTITVRQVSNGFITEQITPYGLIANQDIQAGVAVHSTPQEVANYIENFLSN